MNKLEKKYERLTKIDFPYELESTKKFAETSVKINPIWPDGK